MRTLIEHPLDVVVEVSRGGRVKHHPNGRLQYISPLPSPFNYGFAPGLPLAPDGDPQDVIVLGPRLSRGARLSVDLLGQVLLTDANVRDDKWIGVPTGTKPPEDHRSQVAAFFKRYRWMKGILATARRRPGVVLLDTWWR